MNENLKRLPRQIELPEHQLLLRRLEAGDIGALAGFIGTMPVHDLLYVPRDVTNPKVLDAWGQAEQDGAMSTVVALDGGDIVGSAAIVRDPLSWSPHVGEVRVLVGPKVRRAGLGCLLLQECFAIALEQNLTKLVAQMTIDQRGAFAIFEELGFRGEALLRDHVRDKNGDTHDIAIMSCNIDHVHQQRIAYGAESAFHN